MMLIRTGFAWRVRMSRTDSSFMPPTSMEPLPLISMIMRLTVSPMLGASEEEAGAYCCASLAAGAVVLTGASSAGAASSVVCACTSGSTYSIPVGCASEPCPSAVR